MQIKKKYKFAWITIFSEELCEIYCSFPFYGIIIDLEHSSITESQAISLIRIIQLYKKKAYVRVASKKSENLKKVLDFGADGIIVPDIKNKQDCISVINDMYYANIGNRGVGLHRANEYGNNFEKYFKSISKKIIFIAIIESQEAYENIDEIMSLDKVKGLMIGPYDLSSSLGDAGNFNSKKFKDIIKSIKLKSKNKNKLLGMHLINPNKSDIKDNFKDFSFLIYGLDTVLFNRSIKELF